MKAKTYECPSCKTVSDDDELDSDKNYSTGDECATCCPCCGTWLDDDNIYRPSTSQR